MSKLVLIDGHAMLYRAFFAFPQTLTTPDGKIINAVYGFSRILLNVIKELQPSHLATSFDVGKTWRHKEYPDYKAHREKMPEELKAQETDVYAILETMNIPVYSVQDYEADDVVGTLAVKVSTQEKVPTIIVTGDMDILQLVHDASDDQAAVTVFKPGNGRKQSVEFNELAVKEKYQFTPKQIIDFKAMAGDNSDNIPGIRGVGKVTATKLLSEFGSLEAIYQAVEEADKHEVLKGAMLKNLIKGKEQAFQARKLVTIATDLRFPFKLEDARLKDYDPDKVRTLFQQLGFKSLLRELPKSLEEENFETKVQQALF